MLSELINFIKMSFKRRMYLYEIQVISLSFLVFPHLLLGSICISVFLITAALLTPSLTSYFTSQLKFLLLRKYEADEKIKNEVNRVADRLGVRVKKVRIAKGLCNAFVCFGTLVLGEELLNCLDYYGRMAVFAHELGHMKEKHTWLKIVAIMALLAIPLWSWRRIYSPTFISEDFTQLMLTIMINIALLAYSIMVMIPVNWYLEIRADRIAVEVAGKASLISALLAITSIEGFELPSEGHPAMSQRIKLILGYKPNDGLIKSITYVFSRPLAGISFLFV